LFVFVVLTLPRSSKSIRTCRFVMCQGAYSLNIAQLLTYIPVQENEFTLERVLATLGEMYGHGDNDRKHNASADLERFRTSVWNVNRCILPYCMGDFLILVLLSMLRITSAAIRLANLRSTSLRRHGVRSGIFCSKYHPPEGLQAIAHIMRDVLYSCFQSPHVA
jgi:hypothetical protein